LHRDLTAGVGARPGRARCPFGERVGRDLLELSAGGRLGWSSRRWLCCSCPSELVGADRPEVCPSPVVPQVRRVQAPPRPAPTARPRQVRDQAGLATRHRTVGAASLRCRASSECGMTMVRPPRDGERVAVECWCQAEVVWVLVEDVRRGLTGRCRRGRRCWQDRPKSANA
jgi:hypothetical protein